MNGMNLVHGEAFALPVFAYRISGAGGKGGANYNLFSAGLDYFLSRRTDVYTIAVYEKTSGTDSLGQSAVAQMTGLTPSTNDKQVSLRVGIRHKF